jgi:hypothetical protein
MQQAHLCATDAVPCPKSANGPNRACGGLRSGTRYRTIRVAGGSRKRNKPRRQMFSQERSREGTGHAIYKTDQALLFNAPCRSDFCNFGVTGRAGVARGLWARPATSRHRRLYASADRLRDSARGKPFSRDLSGVEARRPHVHSCGRRAARRSHPMAKRRAGLLWVWQAADRSPRS